MNKQTLEEAKYFQEQINKIENLIDRLNRYAKAKNSCSKHLRIDLYGDNINVGYLPLDADTIANLYLMNLEKKLKDFKERLEEL